MRMKKLLSLFLALVMVLSLVPATVFATEEENVYISVSFDGQYIDGQNGDPIVYVPVSFDELAAIDLVEYGLSDYLYDPDGDGNYETTALQLIIYAHENIYGGSWDDVTFTGSPGGSYFEGGIFGFDENLNYFLNGEFPIDEELAQTSPNASGATSDHIVLEAGDFLDLASFTSYAFLWDSAAGFHLFADESDGFVHNYTAKAGEALSVKLLRSYSDMTDGSAVLAAESGYELSYGAAFGTADGTVTTDDSGCAELTFDTAGTYYLWCSGNYGIDADTENIVSSPAYATVTVKAEETSEPPRTAQDVSAVLNATMAKMASTVTEPVFGTTAGEWTVFGLARGGYYAKDNAYFTDYYNRIVETVNTTAASVNLNGALHKSKSTDNSRLIVALSAIGKDATSVGDWDLVEAYSANGFTWIKKQGLNGPIWALIALDSHNYATTDTTIRQQCVDAILAAQHDDGGWALSANLTYASDPDITGMALTALYPYRDQTAVAEACAEAFACLSGLQHENGTFASGGAECSESCAWVIIACTAWGINPDTDSRFIKNGNSVVDGLLAHYVEEEAMFQHIIGAGTNAMGTDQGCYGLVAYDRFINDKAALFDYSDVEFDTVIPGKPKAYLSMPAEITNDVGTAFTASVTIDQWDNEAGYKLVDMVMSVPKDIAVTGVTASRLDGGEVSYHMETLADGSGKLRVVYFDATTNTDITMRENTVGNTVFPAVMFTIDFEVAKVLEAETTLSFAITGMSLKKSSDSTDDDAMVIVNTDDAKAEVEVVEGISYTAVCLYTGDDVDLIPADKKAVAVFVTGLKAPAKLTYNDSTNKYDLIYSEEMKNGDIHAYVALVDASMDMENFVNKDYYRLEKESDPADSITFGDTNSDTLINAQDALAAVDAWLRKGEAPEGKEILVLNVNGDSRINTFDALGIVEHFVGGGNYGVVTKAATAAAKK